MLYGGYEKQLSAAAKSLGPDMIVVGDHKLLKLTPFGRVGFLGVTWPLWEAPC